MASRFVPFASATPLLRSNWTWLLSLMTSHAEPAPAVKTISETNARYVDWWAEFLPEFHEAHRGWSNAQTPPAANWMNFPSGKSGVRYGLSFAYPTGASNYSLRAEVYVDDGEAVYPELEKQRPSIERICDLKLQWESLENARASRVAVYLDRADPADRDSWPRYRDWAIKTLGELRTPSPHPSTACHSLASASTIGGADG